MNTKVNLTNFIFRIEEQVQAMSFGDETGEYSSIMNGNYQSVDSKKFNHKLNIEDTYAEIDKNGNVKCVRNSLSNVSQEDLPEYATVDINKKREGRRVKSFRKENPGVIYEDIGTDRKADETNIYELVSSEGDNFEVYSEVQDKREEDIYSDIYELNNVK